jgi:hypothetical protein
MAIIQDVSRFYRDIAPKHLAFTRRGVNITTPPITRVGFLIGSALAVLVLIEKIALSIFFLVVNIFTCFQNQDSRTSLLQNVQEIPTYLGAIPFGCIGAVLPQAINETLLHLPENRWEG